MRPIALALTFFVVAQATWPWNKAIPDRDQVVSRVSEINLRRPLLRTIKEQDWSAEKATEVEKAYREFLVSCFDAAHKGSTCVPTSEIDEIWHNHMLFTQAYAKDTREALGFFLHHEPFDQRDEQEIDAAGSHQHDGSAAILLQSGGCCGGMGGDTESDTATGAACAGMGMTFHSSSQVSLLFPGWETTTGGGYAGALIVLILLGIVREWLVVARKVRVGIRKLEKKEREQDLLDSILYGASVSLAYILMLAVMTFNVGVFLAVIGGFVLGHYFFTVRGWDGVSTWAKKRVGGKALVAERDTTASDSGASVELPTVDGGDACCEEH